VRFLAEPFLRASKIMTPTTEALLLIESVTGRRYEELTEEQIMERQVRRRLWETDLGRWRLTLIDILEQQRDRKG
jgi:hypothetical protein